MKMATIMDGQDVKTEGLGFQVTVMSLDDMAQRLLNDG